MSHLLIYVFRMKQYALLKNLKELFKYYMRHIYIIKYQKRGFSYMHCFLFLHQNDNFLKYIMIDNAICAELPFSELNSDGNLIKLIQKFMIYELCEFSFFNAFCMIFKSDRIKSYCIKHFSKHFCSEIIVNEDEYPEYCQPQNECI